MDNYPEALEGKTDILAAKAAFVAKDNRIEELISTLVPPVSIFYGPKRETLNALRQKVKRMTGLGILIAQKHNDLFMLQTMKAYKGLATRTTAYKLYENAIKVADSIEQYATDAAGFGFSNEEIQLFRTSVSSFGAILAETGNQLNDRKADRLELANLFKECNKLLKEHLDPFALFVSEIFPEFYRAYSLLRVNGGRRKSSSAQQAEPGEISGTVIDSVTNEPISGVIISIPEYDLVTETDEDGYYLFSELLIGKYKLKCSKTGYQVPDIQNVELSATTPSLDVDFILEAADAVNAA
jgi:hypothetical protein